MSTRKIVFLLSAIAVGVFGVESVNSKRAAAPPASPAAAQPVAAFQEPAQETAQDRPGTIDGAEHPEAVPDHAAYSVLFRLVADRQTPEEKGRIESYIRRMLGIGCKSCHPLQEAGRLPDTSEADRTPEQESEDIAAVLAAAEEFHRQVSTFDGRAKAAKAQRKGGVLPPTARAELDSLQTRKNGVVNAAAASLLRRLSPASRSQLRAFVREHLKRKIKMVPAASVARQQGGS